MENVIYINLTHRTDRLTHIKDQFHKMGISAERVNAIKCDRGAIGCSLSHIKCIELAKSRNWPCVCICEDDILFTNSELFQSQLSDFLKSDIIWDVLLLGACIKEPFEVINEKCMRVYNAQTTTGYIVKNHYYDTLLENFKCSVSKLLQGEHKYVYSLDIYWKSLQKQHCWYILTPLSVVQRPDYSNIENRYVDYGNYMLDTKLNTT